MGLLDRVGYYKASTGIPYTDLDSTSQAAILGVASKAPLTNTMASGTWYPATTIMRLILNGSGTITIDAMDIVGNITAGVYTNTISGSINDIDFLYAGLGAVKIRASYTSTAIVSAIL
jgi:hypothetical protein